MSLPAFTDADSRGKVYINPLGVSVVMQRSPGVTVIRFENGDSQTVREPAEDVSVKLWDALRAMNA